MNDTQLRKYDKNDLITPNFKNKDIKFQRFMKQEEDKMTEYFTTNFEDITLESMLKRYICKII